MKTSFTFRKLSYFVLTGFLVYLSTNLSAQTSYSVTVSNYQFSPKNLTITAGDEVVWTNSSGSHNVDGETGTFPSNPVSFGNSIGVGWTYKFTFNTPGTYNYQCDPHAAMGMVGQIVVNPKIATSTNPITEKDAIRLYPNPATQFIEVQTPLDFGPVALVKIYSITGSMVTLMEPSGNAELQRLNVSSLKNGIYFIEINSSNKSATLKFIKQ